MSHATEHLHMRCYPEDKERWATAAQGRGGLTAWVTATLNAACSAGGSAVPVAGARPDPNVFSRAPGGLTLAKLQAAKKIMDAAEIPPLRPVRMRGGIDLAKGKDKTVRAIYHKRGRVLERAPILKRGGRIL
jgi:hypothetical protein